MASRSWNRVELIGNVTRDPEIRYTPSGAAVCTFSIATNRTFVSDGEKREETDFHRLVAWNKLAELCSQLIKKGNRIFVSGRLQNRSWETADGQNRQTTEIVIEDMILLTNKMSATSDYAEDIPAEVPTRPVEEMPPSKQSLPSANAEGQVKSDKDTSAAQKSEEPKPEVAEEKAGEPEPEKTQKAETEEVGDLDDLPF